MGGNVTERKVRRGRGLRKVKEEHRVVVLCRHGSVIAHVC